MEPTRWQHVKDILDAVEASSPDRRREHLRELCGDDSALLRDVESFLEYDDEGLHTFIQEPLWDLAKAAPEDPILGRRIGPYRLERLLGRGGMGEVYLAAREDDYEQKVALKLVKTGLRSEEIEARFYNERQILAHLQHPHIARLLDGGTTADGLPYFVLEHVDGEPVDDYCEKRKLAVRERLQLFRKICMAVQFAHQNLVVHRDLKPSNILITPAGEPKLLDFGIAKILAPNLASRDLETLPGHHPMTPNYASPEQILDQPVTTVSDVYALGVLLYRLLTGRSPYRFEGQGFIEMARVICHDEPISPSTEMRRRPPTDQPRHLWRALRGDLDAIVAKAMCKEAQHRYNSTEQLSEDLRRHLAGLPILARRGHWTYRVGKFARRQKLMLAMVLLILVSAITTTVLWRQAVDERTQAVTERERADTVVNFLQDLFKSARPDETRGEDVTALELLDRGKERVTREEFEGGPENQADLLRSLGTVYSELGIYGEARKLKELALELRRKAHPEDHTETATELNNLATILLDLGDAENAEKYYREALEMRRRLGQDTLYLTTNMTNLAVALTAGGRYRKARELYLEVLAMYEQNDAGTEIAITLYSLGVLDYAQGDLEKAESSLNRALEIFLRAYGEENSWVASVLNYQGRVLQDRGEHAEAESVLRQALEIRRRILGDEHKRVADTRKNLAELLLNRGETAAASKLLNEALPVLRAALPEDNWALAEAEGIFGWYLLELGRYPAAEPYLTESYDLIKESKGNHSLYAQKARQRLHDLYEAWGKPEESKKYR